MDIFGGLSYLAQKKSKQKALSLPLHILVHFTVSEVGDTTIA